jgi:hypothetical protein
MSLSARDIELLQAPRHSLSEEDRKTKSRLKRDLRRYRREHGLAPLTTWNVK